MMEQPLAYDSLAAAYLCVEEDKENQIDDAVEDLHLAEEEEHSFYVHHLDWFVDVIVVCVDRMLDLALIDVLIFDENCSLTFRPSVLVAQQEYCQASSKVFLEGEGVDLYQGVKADHGCVVMMPWDSMIAVV